jgi:hypothetical protein
VSAKSLLPEEAMQHKIKLSEVEPIVPKQQVTGTEFAIITGKKTKPKPKLTKAEREEILLG